MNVLPENVNPPYVHNYSYLTVMGSRSYGASTPTSDWDFYGFVVPPVEEVFSHLKGDVTGFGRNPVRFEQLELQHVPHPEYGELDVTVYNLVKYFQLVMEGNPNMVDSLFTPDHCVVYMDEVGRHVRENRRYFLSLKMYHTFKGMLWSHLSRLKGDHTKEGRKPLEEKYGYDTKDGYHSLRMLLELEQVLREGDLDLERNSDLLLKVRHGEYTKEYLVGLLEYRLSMLETFVADSPDYVMVPYKPNELRLKNLLVECLEMKFGSLKRFGFGSV